ncbi:MAG: restriction endonuclease, partial [Corynebacterium casei]|nr:restriction endonuclease [Corynebacterium casei]
MENLSLDEIDMAKVVASRTPVDVKLASDVKSIFEQMLGDGKSVINPDIKIWTASVAEDLGARVEQNPIVGTELNQWEKLSLQLADAPDEVLLLAAELVFLREQPIRNSRPETRKEHIQLVLNLLAMTVELPQFMQDCLSRPSGQGGFRSGQGYNGQMWKHLIWCTKFIEHIAAMSDGERQTLQNDPWALQNAMLSSGTDTPDIRNALQFLMRPDYFEVISSVNTKARIREALAPQIGDVSGPEPQDVDKDLLRIRALFAEEIQGPFSFWSPGVIERWQPEQPKSSKLSATPTEPAAAADVAEPRQRHYWVYAPGEKASKWEEFSDGGIMAIGWDELGDFAQYKSQKEIRIRLANGDSNSQPTNSSKAVWDFQNEMEVGDIVYAKNGQSTIVGRGTVTSAPRFADDRDSFQHVREVAWDYVDQWDSEFKLPLK